jgi:hypothetical protein
MEVLKLLRKNSKNENIQQDMHYQIPLELIQQLKEMGITGYSDVELENMIRK